MPIIFSKWPHLLIFWNHWGQQAWITWTLHPIPYKFKSMYPFSYISLKFSRDRVSLLSIYWHCSGKKPTPTSILLTPGGYFSVPVILNLSYSIRHCWSLICFPLNHLFLSSFLQCFSSAHSLNVGLCQTQAYHLYILSLGLMHPLKWLLNLNLLSVPLPSSWYWDSHIYLPAPPTSFPSTLQHPPHSLSKWNCIQFFWTFFFTKFPFVLGDSPQSFKSLPSVFEGPSSFSLCVYIPLCFCIHTLHFLI